jgi:hypothetical protein
MPLKRLAAILSVCAGLGFSREAQPSDPFFGRNAPCEDWVNNKVYQPGERITYQDDGYEARIQVPVNTPPIPSDNGWFWTPTDSCSLGLPPSNLSYSNNPANYTVGTAIAPNNPSYAGGAPTGYSVNPALPTGLSFDTLSGVITGNPSLASPAAAYVITARNVAGSVADTLTLTVSPG